MKVHNKATMSGTGLHRLNNYALAAGAAGVSLFASAHLANAEIVYTPVHVTITRGQRSYLDLNGDGIDELQIQDVSGISGYGSGSLAAFPNEAAGAWVQGPCSEGSFFCFASAIPEGKSIPGGSMHCCASDGTFMLLNGHGLWRAVTNRYLGIRFEIQGEDHYGWARVSVQITNNMGRCDIIAVVSGYAYETSPNTPIVAGQTSASHRLSGDLKSSSLGTLALGYQGMKLRARPDAPTPLP